MDTTTLERIEHRLRTEDRLDEKTRQDLLGLLATFRREMDGIRETHGDHAESIAGFAGAAAHEAIRENRDPALLKLAVEGLSTSVKEMETEHPRLVETVNGICTMLANLGI